MTGPTTLVAAGWIITVTGIALLSIPWAMIIGGTSLAALGMYAAHARLQAAKGRNE